MTSLDFSLINAEALNDNIKTSSAQAGSYIKALWSCHGPVPKEFYCHLLKTLSPSLINSHILKN